VKRICIVPNVSGVGGMVSFRDKFSAGLGSRGIEVLHHLSDAASADSILVIGGTRDLAGLWRARRCGVRIVQRLNGMNWLHRKLKTGLRHYLRAEYGNLILRLIRSRLADQIVYQSEFARQWWQRAHGTAPVPSSVVFNGVDLAVFSALGPDSQAPRFPSDRLRVLMVEGSLMGGYELGLESAVRLVELLNREYRQVLKKSVELMVVGRISDDLQREWQARTDIPLVWAGLLPQENIPEVDRSAHLLYASDINAACPNSVIEALACGLPVLSFDTGALPELVPNLAGRVVSYGGDPWSLDQPDVPALAEAAVEILLHQKRYRSAARQRAEAEFGLDTMVDGYLEVL
jgi:glycosyltransferase involved in cell wall biosynthesis